VGSPDSLDVGFSGGCGGYFQVHIENSGMMKPSAVTTSVEAVEPVEAVSKLRREKCGSSGASMEPMEAMELIFGNRGENYDMKQGRLTPTYAPKTFWTSLLPLYSLHALHNFSKEENNSVG